MKLKKFNENSEWSDEKVQKIFQEYNNFYKLVSDYLEFSSNLYIDDIWFPDEEGKYMQITYYNHRGIQFEYNITKDEYFNELIPFLNDPEVYRSAKKYNV
jgi:hypothetical protein